MIKRPAWAKGAVPTERGWVRGKEILTLRPHTPAEIAEWYAAQGTPVVETPKEEPQKVVKERKPRAKKVKEVKEDAETQGQLLTEAPISNTSIGDMTNTQVEAIENQYGVKVDADANKTLTESSKTDE